MKDRLYLDSNIFIYSAEKHTEFDKALRQLNHDIATGVIEAITSELTLSEVLVKPFADNDVAKIEMYKRSLRNGKTLTVVPVDRNVLIEAASVRAFGSLKLPDAIHFATALLSNCTHLLTNDDRFKSMKNHYKISILPLQQLPLFFN
jgi:predicted nucleic acid-binding protein